MYRLQQSMNLLNLLLLTRLLCVSAFGSRGSFYIPKRHRINKIVMRLNFFEYINREISIDNRTYAVCRMLSVRYHFCRLKKKEKRMKCMAWCRENDCRLNKICRTYEVGRLCIGNTMLACVFIVYT